MTGQRLLASRLWQPLHPPFFFSLALLRSSFLLFFSLVLFSFLFLSLRRFRFFSLLRRLSRVVIFFAAHLRPPGRRQNCTGSELLLIRHFTGVGDLARAEAMLHSLVA